MALARCLQADLAVQFSGTKLQSARRTQSPARQPCRVHASSQEVRRPEMVRKETQTKEVEPSTGPSSIATSKQSDTTIEYQRQQAKDLQKYFRSLKVQSTAERQELFGWTRRAEIQNGRWVMFGLMVGLLTEYATGVDFPNQIRLMVSYLGIADIYD